MNSSKLASESGFQCKIKNRMANSADPDETVRYEPSRLNLRRLHRYGLKGLSTRKSRKSHLFDKSNDKQTDAEHVTP